VTVLTVRKAESVGTYSNLRLVVVGLSVFGAALSLFIQPVLAPLLLLLPTLIVVSERSDHDAVTFLTVLVLALVLIPSGQVVGPLGSAGRPAGLLGLLALWWWAHAHLVADSGVDRSLQPVRISALLFLGAIVASYAAAFVRPIDPLEARAADRGLMGLLGFFGALLLCADGIVDRARLEVLLRRMVMAGAFIAALAVLQFFTGVGLGGVFRIPGLQELGSIQAIQDRSTFNRVSATASHPIELGVVLGMLFPLAVHFGLHSGRRIQWVYVALIGMAVPMSVSRSGTLALGIGALVLWLSWPIAFKVRSAAVAGAFMMAMRLVVPGLLGTIRSLFTSWFVDDSIKGRTNDYPLVGEYFTEAPFIGRGYGTFLPERYIFLDNQYLGLLIETGLVGTVLFLAVVATGYAAARGSRRFADAQTRSLGQALAAGILAGAISAGTFDLFGFGMASGFLFLLMGCAGALWRLGRADRERAAASGVPVAVGRAIS
jgi:O-antigen ligase